jgi:hypothetical protein
MEFFLCTVWVLYYEYYSARIASQLTRLPTLPQYRLVAWHLVWQTVDVIVVWIFNWTHNTEIDSSCRVHNNGCQLPSTHPEPSLPCQHTDPFVGTQTPQQATRMPNNNWQTFSVWMVHSGTITAYLWINICTLSARGSVAGCGIVVQAGRSLVRFPIKSLNFSIVLILPATLWPWGWLSF